MSLLLLLLGLRLFLLGLLLRGGRIVLARYTVVVRI